MAPWPVQKLKYKTHRGRFHFRYRHRGPQFNERMDFGKIILDAEPVRTFASMYVGNIFAYRATDQGGLAVVEDPIGPDNDRHLLQMAATSTKVILAYGQPKHRHLRDRGLEVVTLLSVRASIRFHVLRVSKNGTPYHPLYLPETLRPVVWKP